MALAKDKKVELVGLAEEMQEKLLKDFIRLLDSGKMAPTDRATAARWLKDNNYRVDANDLPPDLLRMIQDMKAGEGQVRAMPEA